MSAVPHIGFIVTAYAVAGLTLAGTVIALVLDNRAQKRLLARLSDGNER